MKIDIQIPKDAKGLYTLAKALTEKEIAERNPAWYAPEALRYDDCLLIDDWDSTPRIAILDPHCDYVTLEITDAITRYSNTLFDDNASRDDRVTANCVLDLLIAENLIDDRQLRDKLKTMIRDSSSKLWPK